MPVFKLLKLTLLIIWPFYILAGDTEEKDLVAYWNFDEGVGTVAHDSFNKNDGTSKRLEWAKGKRGYGVEFNRSPNSGINCGSNPLIDIDADITILSWIKLTSPEEQKYNYVLSKGQAEKGTGYYIRTCGNDIQLVTGNGIGGYNSLYSSFKWDNNFHHVAFVISGQIAAIYIDGEKIADKKFNVTQISDSTSPLIIGSGFNGVIDEVKIYKSALPADFIKNYVAAFANNQLPRFPLTALAVRTKTKINIDARLDDWTSSCPIFLDTPKVQASRYNLWDAPDIFSAVTSLMFDDKALYIAAYVNDKNIHCDNIKQSDMLEFKIEKTGNKDVSLFFLPKLLDGTRCYGNIETAQIETTSQITDKGYIIEARIPFTAIGLSPDDISKGELQIAVHDTEQGGDNSMIMRSLYWNGENGKGKILFLNQFEPEIFAGFTRLPSFYCDKKFYCKDDKSAKFKAAIPPPYNDYKTWALCLFDKKGEKCISQKIILPKEQSIVPTEISIDISLNDLNDNTYYAELSPEKFPIPSFKIESSFTMADKKGVFLKNSINEMEKKCVLISDKKKKENLLALIGKMKECRTTGDYEKADAVSSRISASLNSNKPIINIPWGSREIQQWKNKIICGRDFYYFIPWNWEYFKMAGLEKEPFIVNGAFFNKNMTLPKDPANIFGKPESEENKKLLSLQNPVMMMIFSGHPDTVPFSSQYQQTYESCRKSFGDRFLGTFIVMGELLSGHPKLWSEEIRKSLETSYKQKIEMPKNREEAYEYVKKIYSAKLNGTPYKTIDLPPAPNLHFFNKQGVNICIPEIGGWEYCTQMILACARGAARQYDKAWGTYIASYQKGITKGGDSEKMYDHLFPWTRKCSASNRYDFGPGSGTSLSLMKRMLYASYMSGANFVYKEGIIEAPCGNFIANYDFKKEYGADEWLPTLLQDKHWYISELGDVYREMYNNIVTNPEKDRGVTYTPVALLFDRHHGAMTNRLPDKIYNNPALKFNAADYMERSVYNTVFPYEEIPQGQTYEAKTMVTGPFGDIFDMLDNDASEDVLKNYPVIFLVGNVTIDNIFADKLKNYVRNGGVLIANICQLNQHLPASFFGCKALNEKGESLESLSLSDCSVIKEKNPFTYEKVALLDNGVSAMETIKTPSPILVVNKYGAGTAFLTTPLYLMDMTGKNKMLNIFSYLIKNLSQNFIPFTISGDSIEYIINRTKNGYVITLINNDGIYKHAGKKEVINHNESKKIRILFKNKTADKKLSKICDWMNNTVLQEKQVPDGIEASLAVPPGDVRIIEFKF